MDADIAVVEQHTKDTLERRRDAYAACRDEAIAHSIDLHDFGTRITVEDYEWVRQALGVDRWNVYSESYGTTVAVLAAILGSELAAFQQLNWAVNAAVECRDRPHLHEPLPAGAETSGPAPLNDICESWSDVGPVPLIPTGSSVPTLVLAGEFDPVAGSTLSRQIAHVIGNNAHWIEFPRVGHNVRAFSACGAKIASNFIDHPTRPIDASCVDKAAPIRFLPRTWTH